MGKIKVHAGDFISISPSHSYTKGLGVGPGVFHLATSDRRINFINTEAISAEKLVYLALASEENVKSMSGSVGWGVAGGLLLGPAGLLAGLLLGGRGKSLTFIAKFEDGRKFIGSTDPKTWVDIQAGALHLI